RRRLDPLRLAPRAGAAVRARAGGARAQVLLRRALRRRLLPAGRLPRVRARALDRAAAGLRVGARAFGGRAGPGGRHQPAPDRPRSHVRARDRRERRRRHPRLRGGALMDRGWLTTALILLPAAGALVVWILPLRPFAVGSTALLVAPPGVP